MGDNGEQREGMMPHDRHAMSRPLPRRTLLRAASGGCVGAIAGLLASCDRTATPHTAVSPPGATPVAPIAAGMRPILVTVSAAPGGPTTGLAARPVDPLTLADAPGAAPLSFAHHYSSALGPGGRTMAVFSWPDGATNTGGALQFIDLPTWTATPTAATADDFVSGALFTAGGRYLYWMAATRRDRAHDLPLDFDLVRYDRDRDATRVVASLPPSFVPDSLPTSARLLHNDTELAIYGLPTDGENLASDAPHLLIVDLQRGTIRADVRLEGVKAGQFAEGPLNTPTYQRYEPGLTWDLARDRLYIGHAEAGRITAVDLAGGSAQPAVDTHPTSSAWERIARWLMPTVAAKGGPSNGCAIVPGRDGARLFLARYGRERRQRPDGTWAEEAVPSAVQVVDAGDVHLIRTLDLPARQMMPTPDGRTLLAVVTDGSGEATADATQGTPTRLLLIDTQTLDERGGAVVADGASLVGFSPDGRTVYLHGATRPPVPRAGLLQVFSLDTQRIVAERTLASGGGNLLAMRDW